MIVQSINPYVTRGRRYGRAEYPPQFKSLGKEPVRGGRWSVRKKLNGRWRVWTTGTAKDWNTIFWTWDYAIKWAHFVAQYHESHLPKGVSREYLRFERKKFRALDEELYLQYQSRRIDLKVYPNRRQNHP